MCKSSLLETLEETAAAEASTGGMVSRLAGGGSDYFADTLACEHEQEEVEEVMESPPLTSLLS